MPWRGCAALSLILALSVPASAVEAPGAAALPVPPPLPPERPGELRPQGPAMSPAPTAAGPAAVTDKPELPIPPPKPPERPPELSGEAAAALKVAPPDDTACRVRLRRLGAAFEPLPPISEGQCSAPLPLKLTALADGVALPQGATLTCRTAEALARWASEVRVEAERTLKHPLTALEIGGSYVCRGQNHDVEAKLSDHAFASAVDVMGFALSGRAAVPVKAMPPGSDEATFLDAVRAKACGFFRTVLGPGSNAAHADHFHLDERERNAGHRLCQ
jgi:hypothetical protein